VAENDPHGDPAGAHIPPEPADSTGSAAFRRQVAAIAEDRGLAANQVAGAEQLENIPDVTPTAFAAIAGIVDRLCDTDARLSEDATRNATAMERNDTDDG